jgi:hypothetical protein
VEIFSVGCPFAETDVTSLYTNIPHNDGIEACREAWDQRAVKEPPTECLVQLLTLVLKHNNFTFNGEHFFRNKNGPRRKGVHGFHFLKIISGVFQM